VLGAGGAAGWGIGLRVGYPARLEDRGKALPAISAFQPKSL